MSTEASVRCLGVDGSSSTLVRLGRRLRSDLPALLERLRVDNGTMGIFCAVGVEEEKAVRGREVEHAGSAGRLRSRLTSNFWDAVELDGEDGASATVNGRRGDEAQLGVDVGADNMGGTSSWLARGGILIQITVSNRQTRSSSGSSVYMI